MLRTSLVVVCLALAGCVDADVAPQVEPGILQGVVVDDTLSPLAGVDVWILGTNVRAVSDEDGAFQFSDPPFLSGAYVVRANLAGYYDGSHVETRPVADGDVRDIRITMSPLPDDTPYSQQLRFNGFIGCSLLVVVGHNHGGNAHEDQDTDCGGEATREDEWILPVGRGIRNVVIDVQWEADTPLADYLSITIDGPGLDNGNDQRFYFVEGTSPLRGTVSQLQSDVFYRADGGEVRIRFAVAGPEADAVVAAALNQDFQAIATMFYVEPGPSDFTAVQ